MKKYIITLALAAALQAHAQGYSPAAMEQMKMQRLWLHSQNAAGMAYDDANGFSNLNVGYNLQDGNFHRPQEGRKTSDIGVSAEGFMNLKSALVWGSFSFAQSNLTDAGYNASITDPFRGMPYYVIDEHQSDWRNQYYDLRFRASTPLKGRWTFGVEGIYKASLAAKQRDPRVDTRFYNLHIVPSLTYQLNEANRLGLSLKYESIKEDSRMENEVSDIAQNFYILYGLGTAVQDNGNGRTANYYGDRFGAALQYNFLTPAWNVLVEASYDVRAENVEQSPFTSPRKDAGVKDKTFRASATAYRQGKTYSHYLKGTYTNRQMDGIQYVSKYDEAESLNGWEVLYKSIRSTYDTQAASIDYALMRNREGEYNWKVEAGVQYVKQNDEYLLPYSTKNYENLTFALGGKKNFVVGSKHHNRLLVDIHAAYNKNLSGGYTYGGAHADYISVTVLETSDTQYLTSDFHRLGASLTYSQQVKEGQKMHFYARAAYDRVSTSDFEFDGRNYFSVSLGCNF